MTTAMPWHADSATTPTPFWHATLCRGCGAALIGSEIRHGACGHCGRRFLSPSAAAPAGKPKVQGVGVQRMGRRGRRRSLVERLDFWRAELRAR